MNRSKPSERREPGEQRKPSERREPGELREPRFQGFSIDVLKGPDAAGALDPDRPAYRATQREVSIGTSPGSSFRLSDKTVSRHHFSLTSTPKGLLLRDLGSLNGTHIGALRVEAGYIDDSADVQIGTTTLRISRLDEEIHEETSPSPHFGGLLGGSPVMRQMFAALGRIARSDSTVLIEGETGTGKEALANEIHKASARSHARFAVLDCTSLAPTLVESELFGHQKGGYTGAIASRDGAFKHAHGGTLLIDEIGELPRDLQPKLLRALETRKVKPVGSDDAIDFDVRVIAATNRDLRAEVNRGTFREDLYYRLNILRIHVPPLRERPEDIEQLARHFWSKATDRPISTELLEAFRRQPWPGNVRELRGAVERAIVLGDEPLSSSACEPRAPTASAEEPDALDLKGAFSEAKQRAEEQWEARYLRALFTRTQGNISEAARQGKMDRGHLRALLKKHGII